MIYDICSATANDIFCIIIPLFQNIEKNICANNKGKRFLKNGRKIARATANI